MKQIFGYTYIYAPFCNHESLKKRYGENYFNIVAYIFSTWFGKIIIFGITWALFHHMLGGLRHLVWDNVKGFDLKNIDLLAIGTLFGGILLTLIFWVLYFIM